jgi:predicted ribosomally synthesized peptide with nif11-like leader
MSVSAFLDTIKTDEALSRFVEELGVLEDTSEAIGRLVSIGVENGFPFTTEELQKELERRAAELSDDELESIAGGASERRRDPLPAFCFKGRKGPKPTPNQIIGILVG